ncbi:2-hydroxyacid dehydrogenase [Priestia endophytica]|uniref:2-hydroxyacid dehydrogenase n=1 Tax=Priestia endophytica TaxID=135735 RepID=UPI000F52FFBA|nr:2-hydroxyacid dehydrogenase [Priestia endophytica]RPJ99075.1 D-3-phosphoglycerate dehydrogenase [Priestia endophytica]
MSCKIIYFEKMFTATREIINTYKSVDMEVNYWVDLNDEKREQALREANYLITASYPITRELLEKAPNVKLIQKTGSGVDNIDLKAAAEFGIHVASTPGANSNSVVELTIGMIISLYRKLHFLDRLTKNGEWKMWEYRTTMFEMNGKTHGVIGIGNIGRKVAQLSKAFGTNVIYYDVNRLSTEEEKELGITYVTFDNLVSQSDIISLHIPLIPETRNLISDKELNLMKSTAILVNVARGNIIDEQALAEALKCNRLLGAALDTWASEPINSDNPLLQLDNVLATPHIAGGTRDVLETVLRLSFENIRKVEAGSIADNLVKVVSKSV